MRAFNRVLSLLLGLALLAGGLLVAAEVAAALLDRGELVIPARRWADELRATTFADARVVFGVVAAVGLVLFVAEARRWPTQRVPLADDQQRSWWLLRRSLEQHLGRAVTTGTAADRRPGPGTPTAPAATGAPGRRRRPHRQAGRRATRRPGA